MHIHALPITSGYAIAAMRLLLSAMVIAAFSAMALAAAEISEPDEHTLEIGAAPDMQVIAVAKTVVIKKSAKSVFVFGGDVIIEGEVTEDVGVVGGTVTQKEGAFVGGDIIVVGGAYKPEGAQPRRNAGKETVVLGILEDELRELGQNPSRIFSPELTPAYLAQRLLSALFWFLVTLGFATIAPGALSRAIARTKLSALKVAGLGLAGLIASLIFVGASMSALPQYLSVIVWLMVLGLLMLAYLFGRVTLQASTGKFVQKHLVPGYKGNETVSILTGVLIWTLLLSLPYVWIFALLTLFSVGVGLVLTARNPAAVRPA